MKLNSFILLLLIVSGCSSSDEAESDRARLQNATGEYIYRNHNEYLFKVEPPLKIQISHYPWESHISHQITKDYFRCKGSNLNPPHVVQKKGETVRFFDCGGAEKHSLPLYNSKEFIYPILIDLLNYIQNKSGKKW